MTRTLLTGGIVLSQDERIGDLEEGDVLIEGDTIVDVGPRLDVTDAEVVDVRGQIVLPGFVDTHRHMWQGAIGGLAFDWNLGEYLWKVLGTAAAYFRPEDVYAGGRMSAMQSFDAGITTVFDFSHISNSPEHADAAVDALFATGIRAVYGYGAPGNDAGAWYGPTSDIRQSLDVQRLASERFSSTDQLVTLGLTARGPELSTLAASLDDIAIGRDLGVVISLHMGAGRLADVHGVQQLHEAGALGPDLLHVHLSSTSDAELDLVAASGGKAAICPRTEMSMGHGYPAIGRLIERGIVPTPSMDVVTGVSIDMFDEMRALLEAERALVNQRALDRGDDAPPFSLTAKDAVRFATIGGATALGLDAITGSITPGKKADIVVFDPRVGAARPATGAYASILFGQLANVDTVLVGGELRKRKGQIVGIDVDAIVREAEASREHVLVASDLAATALRTRV